MSAKIWIDTDKSYLPIYNSLNRKPFNIVLDGAVLGELKYYDRNHLDVDAGAHTITLQGRKSNLGNTSFYSCETQHIHLLEGDSVNLLSFADLTGKRLYLTNRRNKFRVSLLQKLVRTGKRSKLLGAILLRLLNRKEDAVQQSAGVFPEKYVSDKHENPQGNHTYITEAAVSDDKPLTDSERDRLLEEAELYKRVEGDDLPYLIRSHKIYNRVIASSDPRPDYFLKRANVMYDMSHRSSGNYLLGDAIKDISTAIQLDPDNGRYYVTRGVYQWENLLTYKSHQYDQQVERIISDFRTCISKNPTLSDAWLNLMAIHLVNFHLDETISLYGQCELYMATAEEQLIRSYLGCLALILSGDLLEQGDKKYLVDRTIELHSISVRESVVSDFLGSIRSKNWKVWPEISKIIGLLVSHYNENAHRGDLLRRILCFEESLSAYDEALAINPDNISALVGKSFVLISLKRHDEVLELLERVIELNPSYAGIWLNIATTLLKMGRFEAAIEAYDKAIKLNPDYGPAWHSKGIALQMLHRTEQARFCFLRAENLNFQTSRNFRGCS